MEFLIQANATDFQLKYIVVVDNALGRQFLHHVDIVSGVHGTFRTNLVTIKNAKAHKHLRRLLGLSAGEMLVSRPRQLNHVFPCDLGLHHGEIRIFDVKFIVKAQGGCHIHSVAKGVIRAIMSLHYINEPLFILFVHHFKGGIFLLA